MSSAPTDAPTLDPAPRRPLVERPATHAIAWALITFATAAFVALHFSDAGNRAAALNGRFFEDSKNSSPFLVLLLAAPLVWQSGRRRRERPTAPAGSPPQPLVDFLLALVFAAAGTFAARWYAAPFAGLPPAIHDEYSYLFQAETFLDGRTWLPSFPEYSDLFDQMHVLNEGRFASRYFPGVGAWLAPFVSLGNPWEGQWLANGLIAAGLFLVGRLLSGRAVGIVAGLLYVVSPGMLVFSNMLVAHMPTMLGLILFLSAMLACRQRPSAGLALIAGTGLAFAMLCRPMTAAGFALPFGIDWIWRLIRRQPSMPGADTLKARLPPSILQTLALGFPLVIGAVGLLAYNHSITGDALVSPYQLYTDLYTPRHVYGFNNVTRGEKVAGPKTLEHYDSWAENLTPALALKNVGIRATSSSRWTLATIPLLLSLAVVLLDWRRLSAAWKLVCASIVSLHAVHIPYWFTGIMDWHYVFESGPLLLLIIAYATVRLGSIWRSWSMPRMRLWWAALLALAILINDISIEPLWTSRVAIARSEAMFARRRYGQFRAQAEELATNGPMIVFVKPDPTDLHMDYVTNRPTLDGPVLVARLRPSVNRELAARLFPERTPFVFDAAKRQWSRLGD
ncbi:hypothetical protein Pan44_48460 [Caulifigura coniformis]|uniref:Uncharacterized protein n=1 Tax=Caulifigura coniformis TaxID=2527983 RepID=A0A517SKZ0_9PLAN|nr:glycosyltransferase family 39 protein [Caulifigura coniformis]QDT56786.1 hypothetical protein Pan44_48460 [Caulifigura coniformis]